MEAGHCWPVRDSQASIAWLYSELVFGAALAGAFGRRVFFDAIRIALVLDFLLCRMSLPRDALFFSNLWLIAVPVSFMALFHGPLD